MGEWRNPLTLNQRLGFKGSLHSIRSYLIHFGRDDKIDDTVFNMKNKNQFKKEIIVALIGNPNSGKTSIFNELVGAKQKVGNWPGVTIEKYEGVIEYQGYKIKIIDLPGTYSLTAYSPEEVIARDFIIKEKPDVVINVVDGSNLERNLLLTTQLMELGANMIIALNMYDEVENKQIKINFNQLEQLLGTHIVPTSAIKKSGFNSLLDHVVRVHLGEIKILKNKLYFQEKLEETILKISNILASQKELKTKYNLRWLAIKFLENDKIIYKLIKEYPVFIKIERFLIGALAKFEKEFNKDPELAISEGREAFIKGAIQETVKYPTENKTTKTDFLDSIIINRILGLPIFFFIMWIIFQFTFLLAEAPMGWIEAFFIWLGELIKNIVPAGLVQSVLVDGIIAGVGGTLVFLPQILLLFMGLSFLEGTGYMARAAFVVDKIMHKMGLHGKSFLPMITGFGCSIPALMATRTLKNRGDRLVTMMIIPFMSCSAKLPVHILLISAFFPAHHAGNVLFGVYLFGVVMAIITARLLKSILFKDQSEVFVMELPPYRVPTLKTIFIQAKNKAYMFLRRAGTIILLASIFIWSVSNFPHSTQIEQVYAKQKNQVLTSNLNQLDKEEKINQLSNQEASEQLAYSAAGRFGKAIEPVIEPLGFDWRIGIALTSGLAAKEIVVATLSTIYSLGDDSQEIDLATKIKNDPKFNMATGLALIVFVLLYIPCIAAITVFYKEARSWKILGIYFVYSMTVAWVMAFLVYNLSRIFI